jgi:hypothetical protein
MKPHWCHSSFETPLARLLRMRSGTDDLSDGT